MDNARIKKIVDEIFKDKGSPLVKNTVVACDVEELENADIFAGLELSSVPTKPQGQNG